MGATTSVPLVALAAVGVFMTLAWLVSLAKRDASLVDVCWGSGFVLASWVYAGATPTDTPRKWLALALVTLWGVRLSVHILWRGWGEPEDYRYQAMRRRAPERFPWLSLVTVFWFQGLLLWAISMPLYQAQRSSEPAALGVLDGLALVLFAIGFTFEAVGDWQLARFKADPDSRGRVLDTGLWRYTRHPNYFGDAVQWWAFSLLALATPGGAWTLYAPVVMTFLLMRVSGVPLLERKLRRTRPEYAEYVARTSSFFPRPPRAL